MSDVLCGGEPLSSQKTNTYEENTPVYTPCQNLNDSMLSENMNNESFEDGPASATSGANQAYDCLAGGSLETIDERSKSEMECTMTAEEPAQDESSRQKENDSESF